MTAFAGHGLPLVVMPHLLLHSPPVQVVALDSPQGWLLLQGKGFPLVSAALMLLKMLDE